MQYLDLGSTSLSDEGLQSFVEGMSNCCRLKELHLSYNRSITANGVASLSSMFRAEHCSLCTLALYNIHFGDEGAIALANGLIGNKSLTDLRFSVESVTARGWDAFSTLLCDTSSVNNTYLSNHTLTEIGNYHTPLDIKDCLELNMKLNYSNSHNQATAICKILRSHPDIDVTPLFEFNLMCLPLVVAWFEKAKLYLGEVNEPAEVFKNRKLSAMFKFIRGMPKLAADGYYGKKKAKSKKRNRSDQTLCDIS